MLDCLKRGKTCIYVLTLIRCLDLQSSPECIPHYFKPTTALPVPARSPPTKTTYAKPFGHVLFHL